MSSKTEAIIDTYYAALKSGDRDLISTLLTSDITVNYYGPTRLFPWQGDWVGRERFYAFLDKVAESLTIDAVQPRQRIFSQDAAVIVLDGEWTIKSTGSKVKATVANIFTIVDGKISRYQVFTDSAAFGIGVGTLVPTP